MNCHPSVTSYHQQKFQDSRVPRRVRLQEEFTMRAQKMTRILQLPFCIYSVLIACLVSEWEEDIIKIPL